MSTYQVVAECAFVTLDGPTGRFQTLMYKGALVPEGAPELERLIDSGHVKKVGGEVTGGLNSDGVPDGGLDGSVHEGLTTTPVPKSDEQLAEEKAEAERQKAEQDVAEKRAAAQAKLPADGSLPDGRAGRDVWVEYLVRDGASYDDVKDADKADLMELAKSRQK